MKKRTKKRLRLIVGFLIILFGLVALNYPYVSGLLNDVFSYKEIQGYVTEVKEKDTSEVDALLARANEYNKALAGQGDIEQFSDFELLQDGTLLGSVEIPTINVNLVVRFSTSNDVLNKGLGLVENTSLPVGGPSTHAVISGHSGMASMKVLTNLTSVKEGDIFFVRSFADIAHERDGLAYQVDQILVVLPWENEELAIVPGEDYVTLLTCTPYGVNSHRLLVRGKRIEYDFQHPAPEVVEAQEERLSDVELIRRIFFYVSIGILAIMLVVLIVEFVKKPKKKAPKKTLVSSANEEKADNGGMQSEEEEKLP